MCAAELDLCAMDYGGLSGEEQLWYEPSTAPEISRELADVLNEHSYPRHEWARARHVSLVGEGGLDDAWESSREAEAMVKVLCTDLCRFDNDEHEDLDPVLLRFERVESELGRAEAALDDSADAALLAERRETVDAANEARQRLREAAAGHSRIFLRAVAPGGGVSMWPDEYFKLPWAEAARELLTREEHAAATAAAAAKEAARGALDLILSNVLGHVAPAGAAPATDASDDEHDARRIRKRMRDSWGEAAGDPDLESDDEDVGEGWGFGCVF